MAGQCLTQHVRRSMYPWTGMERTRTKRGMGSTCIVLGRGGRGCVTNPDVEGFSSSEVRLGGRITRNFVSRGRQICSYLASPGVGGGGGGLCLAPEGACRMPSYRPGASSQLILYFGLSKGYLSGDGEGGALLALLGGE